MSDNKTSTYRLLLSVVIPAKDEADSIGSLVLKVRESLSGVAHEIIVVDDGSRDETAWLARDSGARVFSHQRNLGKGAAMKTGVQHASGGVVVFLDSDGAHDPQDIAGVIAPILEGKADLVIGSRILPGSKVATFPLRRRLTNSLASLVISVVISFLRPMVALSRSSMKWIKITDCTSGFRAIKQEAWQRLGLTSRGFQIETEMIYEAAKRRLIIREVPISCNWSSEASRLSIFRDGLKTLALLAGRLVNDARNKER